MCGIIGILGKGASTVPLLMDALRRLEYRGYDSAGIASMAAGVLCRRRAAGKITNLEKILQASPMAGDSGVGHTRWATHGKASVGNAHPHMNERIAVVHNGIIENYSDLVKQLKALGIVFESETDSEIILHLLDIAVAAGLSPRQAIIRVLPQLQGNFAFVAMLRDYPDSLFGACRGSPLAVGYGDGGGIFLGSDAYALADLADEISYLHDGDGVALHSGGGSASCIIFDGSDGIVARPRHIVSAAASASKGNHRHYMLKEIYEQPLILADSLAVLLDGDKRSLCLNGLFARGGFGEFGDANFDVESLRQVFLVACGTSFYAGMVARYWLEEKAQLWAQTDIASEFRTRPLPMRDECRHEYLGIFLSQSGESMDTLLALRHAKVQHCRSLALVNVAESAIGRAADDVIFLRAGLEIGVAATKSFTSQLVSLAVLSLGLGARRGILSAHQQADLVASLEAVASLIEQVLQQSEAIQKVTRDCLFAARSALYLGRGSLYPVALEAALKLKEISYIHAEGYAAGEMKHGPIALIDESLPVVVFAPSGAMFDKTLANIQEITARRGRVILLSDARGIAAAVGCTDIAATIVMPPCDAFVAPIIYAVAAQLLAYYTALEKGTDIDQPRNLAKSVTVE